MFSSQFGGGTVATKLINTGQNVDGFTPIVTGSQTAYGARGVLSGALTANTLATIYSKTTGPVSMPLLTVRTTDTTSRTLRVEVTVDGVVVFDRTSAAVATIQRGICLAGTPYDGPAFQLPPIEAASSLVVKVASSLTETDKFAIEYITVEH